MTVMDLFERRVASHPDRIAVRTATESLTYDELDRRANRLANRLREAGLGRAAPVGVCLPNRLDTVIALLGVLKAGGACVPIDPAYPAERIAVMIHDTQAAMTVTAEEPHGVFADLPTRPIFLDRHSAAHGPQRTNTPDDLAYIIYTSGSSGTPKGVAIEHHALLANATNTAELLALTATDVLFQFASPSFVSSIGQIFAPLVSGARVVLRDQERSATQLLRVIEEQGVTVLWLTPSMIKRLIARPENSLARLGSPLRLLRSGGEALTISVVQQWFAESRVPLLNVYGPTEAVQDITAITFTEAPPDVTIGSPLFDAEVFLLDDAGAPVSDGEIGEMYFSTSGMARGYWRRPELTEERFVRRSLGGRTHRVYRTGDLARRRADGQLEHLGRADRQVKLWGFRIELGEIEARLTTHPLVRDAAVVVINNDETPRLIAYYVPTRDAQPNQQVLRDWCAQALPAYSIPTRFQAVEILPLTPNGKIDLSALTRRSA